VISAAGRGGGPVGAEAHPGEDGLEGRAARGSPAAAGRAQGFRFTREERVEEVAEFTGVAGGVELVTDIATRPTEPAETGGRPAGAARPGTRARRRARTGPRVRLPIGAQAVVQRPLVRIGQDGVRLVDLLEPHLGRGVTTLRIGVVLAGQLPEGFLDFLL